MGRRIKGLEAGSRPTLNRAVLFPLLHHCYMAHGWGGRLESGTRFDPHTAASGCRWRRRGGGNRNLRRRH